MLPQLFRGDDVEKQFEASGAPAMNLASISLDQYLESGFYSSPFLLMMYDLGVMPFSERVPRDSFVEFWKAALPQFPFTGTFESYLFILRAIFGDSSSALFEVPAPGKLNMLVNAGTSIYFDWIAMEFDGVGYVYYDMVSKDLDTLAFRGISGIDSEAKLTQVLAEIIPAGIYPQVALAFYSIYEFIAIQSGNPFNVVDHLGNQIVFFETGA